LRPLLCTLWGCLSKFSFVPFTKESRLSENSTSDNVVSKSKKGYITCNFLSQKSLSNNYNNPTEIIGKIKKYHGNLKKIKKIPQGHRNNFILIW